MKYKVGDKVRINSKCGRLCGTMELFGDKVMTISEVDDICYRMVEDNGFWSWDDGHIIGLAEENLTANLEQDYAKLKADYEAKCKELEEYKKTNSQPLEYKRWKPQFGEIYFSIYSFDTITSCTWQNYTGDHNSWNLGNCYKTKEEAEFYLEKQKVTQQLKDLALELNQGWEPNWNEGSKFKYFIKRQNNEVKLDFATTGYIPIPCFKTAELAQKALNTIGKEKLLKYYFGEYEG